MYKLESLDYESFSHLYHDKLVNDFPRSELRPLWMFRKVFKKESYQCIVMRKEEVVVAYACILMHADQALLDYYAVDSTMRGTGLGSEFLSQLKSFLDISGLIIESELPHEAKDQKDELIRLRRIQFYQRNGAILSPYEWHAFGVGYHLMWLPFQEDAVARYDMRDLYSSLMPRFVLKLFTKKRIP